MMVEVRVKTMTDDLDKKLLIIKQMTRYPQTVSMYRVAKDMGYSTPLLYHHFKTLIEQGIIEKIGNKYKVNACFDHLEDHIILLQEFIESIVHHNANFDEDSITSIIGYMLALLTIEVEEDEDQD